MFIVIEDDVEMSLMWYRALVNMWTAYKISITIILELHNFVVQALNILPKNTEEQKYFLSKHKLRNSTNCVKLIKLQVNFNQKSLDS